MSASDVNVSNVVLGHGHLKVDGVSVGAISGGIEIAKATDVYEVYVDQVKTPIQTKPIKETFTVKTNLAEATLKNLRYMWNIPAAKQTGADGQNATYIKVGVSTGVVEHTLEITGVSPIGIRVIQVYRAVSLQASAFAILENKEVLFPVTFTCLADTTKPTGEELATIVDVTGSN